jgi:hypothetical protein
MQNISDRLDKIAAVSDNTRIVSRNAQRRAPQPYIPLQKTVSLHSYFNLAAFIST